MSVSNTPEGSRGPASGSAPATPPAAAGCGALPPAGGTRSPEEPFAIDGNYLANQLFDVAAVLAALRTHLIDLENSLDGDLSDQAHAAQRVAEHARSGVYRAASVLMACQVSTRDRDARDELARATRSVQ